MSSTGPQGRGDGCEGNAAPYVLGALTDEELAAFVVHLQTCAVCREEVAALQSVTAALPASAPQFMAKNRRARRGLLLWMARATNSLPVPVSPTISTGTVLRATMPISL